MVFTERSFELLKSRFVCGHHFDPHVFEQTNVIPVIFHALAELMEIFAADASRGSAQGFAALPITRGKPGVDGRKFFGRNGERLYLRKQRLQRRAELRSLAGEIGALMQFAFALRQLPAKGSQSGCGDSL